MGPAGSSPAPWGRRRARGGGSNKSVRPVFRGTLEKTTSTNTNCGLCCGRGRTSQLKARSDRRLDHRDKTVEHLETRARPGGRRTTRCSARLDRSDDATRLNNGRPPFKDPLGRSHVVDGVPSPSPCSCLLSPCAASTTSLLHTHLKPDALHRHKSALGTAATTWSQSLHHQLAHGARARGPARKGGRRRHV